MEHDELIALRRHHPAWRLLTANSAPLIIGFLHQAFVTPNLRAIAEDDLEEQLADYLHDLRHSHSADHYPQSSSDYLRHWADGEQAFVRRYFAERGDTAYFDLTPASEQAIRWLTELKQREFVGTESRLLTVIEMLRDLVQVAQTDPRARIEALEKRKQAIDDEIQALKAGRFTPGDPRQIKERLFALEDNARRLLGDFRQIEANFRELDRDVREQIAVADGSKGALLDEVFDQRDAIADSDQGKSFSAFWGLLMSPKLQDELAELLKAVGTLNAAKETDQGGLLVRIQDYLLDAGERVQRTSASLTEQLRRYLDDKVWLENKRIMALIQVIQTHAMAVHNAPPRDRAFSAMDGTRLDLNLPLSRGLFRPTQALQLDSEAILTGKADFEMDALYNVFAIDEAALLRNIEQVLDDRAQVTLAEVCDRSPIRQGLAEVVGYLRIASQHVHATIDEHHEQVLTWTDPRGWACEVRVPRIIFTRPTAGPTTPAHADMSMNETDGGPA